MNEVGVDELNEFFDHLSRSDSGAAFAIADRLIDEGRDGIRRLVDVLIPAAMEMVGRKWEAGEWTVAQEHEASEICDRTLSAAEKAPIDSTVRHGTAVIACAEGEWHSLAAKSVRVALHLSGWQTIQLGPSVTSSQLVAAIYDHGPNFVAVTCSLTGNLPGARRMIETGRESGTPVVAGGRAFGVSSERATAFGASGWAPSAFRLGDVAQELKGFTHPVERLVNPAERELRALEAAEPEIVTQLSVRLGAEHHFDGELAAGGIWLLRVLKASLLCQDRDLIVDHLEWHAGRARLGGALPAAVVVRALVAAIPEAAGAAAEWLESAAAYAAVEL